MATELHTTQVREQSRGQQLATQHENAATQPRHETSLQEIVARIGRDSRDASRQYLDETIVPHGGE